MLYVQYTYIYVQFIYLFISNAGKIYETLVLSFPYSSNRTVVVLLLKHFSSRPSASCNSVSIITNCTYATMSESNVHLFQVGLLHLISVQY